MSQPADKRGLESLKTDYRPIAEVTCDRLRVSIIEGGFAPGEQLKERELATLMGVSTTPIKAALQRLALEGLVTSVPFRGSFVTENLPTILAEIGLLRAALEGTAAYLAAMKATAEDIALLRDQIAVMRACTEARDVSRAIEVNARFHELVHEIGRNLPLNQMSDVVRRYEAITRPQALADEEQMVKGLDEHMAVFEAIEARDPELADAKMREHVRRNTRFIEERARHKSKEMVRGS